MRQKAEKKCGIYKITSPTNRIYIGQSVNIKKRFIEYRCLNCKKQPGLFNSLTKHGVENHIFEIIEECPKELLNERERYWQDYYKVIINGLNCVLTEVNELPFVISENTRLLKSQSKIKNNLDNIKENIYQFDLEGNFIKVWKNRTEVKLFYKNINSSNLHRCLADNQNGIMLNGFIWSLNKFVTKEHLEKVKNLLIKKDNQIINQYSLNGVFIKQWSNQKEIFRNLNIVVQQCVNHRNKQAKGFIWKSKNYILTDEDILEASKCKDRTDIVRLLQTTVYQYSMKGLVKTWDNQKQIKKELNYNISRCLKNERYTLYKYVWSQTELTQEEVMYKYKLNGKIKQLNNE